MMRSCVRFVGILLAVALSVACGAKARHVAVVADSSLYEVLSDVHAIEQHALCGFPSCAGVATAPTVAGWSLEKSQAFNQKLLPLVEGGRQMTVLLANWKPGEPVPAQLHTLIVGLASATAALAGDFPPGDTRTRILADIGQAQAIALNALDLVLTVKGGVK